MAKKRFHDIEIWEEDWFIALPKDYRFLWFHVKDTCDHAGILRPNVTKFNKLFDCSVDLKEALKLFNKDKERVVVLKNGRWFLTQFIPFQYGLVLNDKNPLGKSILNLLEANNIDLNIINPHIEVKKTSRRPLGDLSETSRRPLKEDTLGPKDKDKDKDKDKEKLLKGIVKGEWPHFENNEFCDAFIDYLFMRIKNRKPATQRAKELVLKDLHKVSIEIAVEMLHQSIRHSWADVYPPKKNDISQGQLTSGDLEKTIERSLGKMATKDMIKSVLRGIPQNLWWKVDKFLQKRYPHDTRSHFTEAERELVVEIRGSKDSLNKLTASIG